MKNTVLRFSYIKNYLSCEKKKNQKLLRSKIKAEHVTFSSRGGGHSNFSLAVPLF